MKIEPHELREYLLGGLVEETAAELDEHLFKDEEFHRKLHDVQELLIHDFIEHSLPFGDEARFRAQCARSPALQVAVDEVRSLKVALERQREAGIRHKMPAVPRFWIFAFAAPVIALCIVTVYCVALLRGRDRLNSQVAALSHQQLPASISASDGHSFATVFLSANVLRGEAPVPSVKVSPDTSLVELQIEVRTESIDRGDWSVEISHGKEIVWRSLRVPLRRIGQEVFLSVVLDRANLPGGMYEIRCAATANPAAVVTRSFDVVSRR